MKCKLFFVLFCFCLLDVSPLYSHIYSLQVEQKNKKTKKQKKKKQTKKQKNKKTRKKKKRKLWIPNTNQQEKEARRWPSMKNQHTKINFVGLGTAATGHSLLKHPKQ